MKSLPPVNWLRFTVQCCFFAVCCISLWHMLDVRARMISCRSACAQLETEKKRLFDLRQRIERYNVLKDRFLPCRESSNPMIWQGVSITFNDVDFGTLLQRIDLMYMDIDSLYGENTLFFVDDFSCENKGTSPSEQMSDQGQASGRHRIFTISGRLLTACPAN